MGGTFTTISNISEYQMYHMDLTWHCVSIALNFLPVLLHLSTNLEMFAFLTIVTHKLMGQIQHNNLKYCISQTCIDIISAISVPNLCRHDQNCQHLCIWTTTTLDDIKVTDTYWCKVTNSPPIWRESPCGFLFGCATVYLNEGGNRLTEFLELSFLYLNLNMFYCL